MGRRKTEEVSARVIDGTLLLGDRRLLSLPDYLLQCLSSEKRLALQERFSPTTVEGLLDSTTESAKGDPVLAAALGELLDEMRTRFLLAQRLDGDPEALNSLPPEFTERFGEGDAGLETARRQMGELGLWALHLHPWILEPRTDGLPEPFGWVANAVAVAFLVRAPQAAEALRDAWATERTPRPHPSHDKLLVYAYRRELAIRWTKTVLEHHNKADRFLKKQAALAASALEPVVQALCRRSFPASKEPPELDSHLALEMLCKKVPPESYVNIGGKLAAVLVALRAQGGEMKRFLGYAKPETAQVRTAVGKHFKVTAFAVKKAINRTKAKNNVLKGL